jgi:alpha 1,2-mannosyltransferase
VALLTLHAYSPIAFIPKLSLHSKGATVPAKYYNNIGLVDDAPDVYGEHVPGAVQRANATLLMLARNDEIDHAVITIKEMEDRFNLKYGYPWVFLNEQAFSEDFKRWAFPPLRCRSGSLKMGDRRVSAVVSGPVHFARIPDDDWYQPKWINETRAQEERHKMEEEDVIYGGSVSSVFALL